MIIWTEPGARDEIRSRIANISISVIFIIYILYRLGPGKIELFIMLNFYGLGLNVCIYIFLYFDKNNGGRSPFKHNYDFFTIKGSPILICFNWLNLIILMKCWVGIFFASFLFVSWRDNINKWIFINHWKARRLRKWWFWAGIVFSKVRQKTIIPVIKIANISNRIIGRVQGWGFLLTFL